MAKIFRNKNGQSTAEYAIIIALVIGAAMAMQTYIKRGLQGGIKYAVDKSIPAKGTSQYEPYYLESDYTSTQRGYTDTEETKAGGEVVRTVGVGGEKTTERSGYQKIKDTASAD